MSFEEAYPQLWILFAAYFWAAADEYAYPADEEVLAEYCADIGQPAVVSLRAEFDRLLVDAASWPMAVGEANRYFATTEQQRQWLQRLREQLS